MPFDQTDGIWVGPSDRSSPLTLVARSGTAAPGAGGANFSTFFKDPLVNEAGNVSFVDQLKGTGITSSNDTGLWTGNAGKLNLVARTGDHAPGTADGTVFSFPSSFDHALNNLGQVVFEGTVKGPGVDFSNDNGIWVYDPLKGTRLVAREGQTLQVSPTVALTLKSLDLRTGASTGDGRATSLSDDGHIAFTAGFTTGIDYAVLVADIGGIRPGDANQDGIIDGTDLKTLLTGLGEAGSFADGDFNFDGTVNYRDFQLMELNYGKSSPDAAGVPAAAMYLNDGAVPEPGAGGMLVIAVMGMHARRRGRA